MAKGSLRILYRAYSLLKTSSSISSLYRPVLHQRKSVFAPCEQLLPLNQLRSSWEFRNLSCGTVNLIISEGKPKFETHEVEPPRKYKWTDKKRFKLQKKREKEKRKAANRNDPRRLGITNKKKRKFPNAEERIKFKLEKARIKEALLIEKLKRYEVPKLQGPAVEPISLTGEERFYMKKMAQKRTNYVQVGRRGVYGGVILNMHMHWKKHETVEVICKPCKPGQVHEYAEEIARLSGGVPIQVIGDDTIIFYRGKNYTQPEIMSPIDTLSKKKALEKSKYEQSLESVRQFIAISEKELELYHRHIALYGVPNSQDPVSVLDCPRSYTNESRNLAEDDDDDDDESYETGSEVESDISGEDESSVSSWGSELCDSESDSLPDGAKLAS